MNTNTVAFPELGLEFTLTRTIDLGFMTVNWYGLIIAIGFALAVLYCTSRSARFRILPDNLIDMVLIATPVAVVGARLYYVVFNFSLYRDNLWKIFNIPEGGLALYGALIFAVATVFVYTKIKKINVWNMLDIGVLGFIIGQIVGRWGNFVNAEAVGETSGLPWAMSVNGAATVHPIFLYESLWNLLGFILLHFISKKRRFHGQIFLMYLVWYGAGRGFIEGIRGEDTLMLFDTGIRVSQALGFLSAIVALGFLIYGLVTARGRAPILLLSKEEGNALIQADRTAREQAAEEKRARKSAGKVEEQDELDGYDSPVPDPEDGDPDPDGGDGEVFPGPREEDADSASEADDEPAPEDGER